MPIKKKYAINIYKIHLDIEELTYVEKATISKSLENMR